MLVRNKFNKVNNRAEQCPGTELPPRQPSHASDKSPDSKNESRKSKDNKFSRHANTPPQFFPKYSTNAHQSTTRPPKFLKQHIFAYEHIQIK